MQRYPQRTTLPQAVVFMALVILGSIAFFELLALPILDVVFRTSLGAHVQYLDRWFEWMLIVGANGGERLYSDAEPKVYLFNPILSLLPLMVTAGFAIAALVSALLPYSIGLVRKNLHREIANAMQELVRRHAGPTAGDGEYAFLRQRLESASPGQLQTVAEELDIPFDEALLLQRSLLWEGGGIRRILYLGSALRLYMRNHFTVEYEQAVLGSIYGGAAVLIIIIGLRGLQFIPKERPSLVLFAISLEFVLLIAYAVTLIFSQPADAAPRLRDGSGLSELFRLPPTGVGPIGSFQQAEKLLRMFIALPPPSGRNVDDASNPPRSR